MKNFCSKWKYELVCILMELLQGKSITSVIKGIVHLTVMRKGPTLHVSVVLQSFYFKSFLLFRRTEAGFETRKEFSRTFFFFCQKENLPESLQERFCQSCCSESSLRSFVHSCLLSPLEASVLQVTQFCPSFLLLRSCDSIRKLAAEAFSFPGWSLGISTERASVLICIQWGGAGEISVSAAIWAGSPRAAGGGKHFPGQKSTSDEISLCGFGG